MTTLAEDHDSWKASGIIRRDFQHSHDGPEVPRHRRKRPKGSRKWCGRKPGREHVIHTIQRKWGTHWCTYIDVCKVCGKQVRWWH